MHSAQRTFLLPGLGAQAEQGHLAQQAMVQQVEMVQGAPAPASFQLLVEAAEAAVGAAGLFTLRSPETSRSPRRVVSHPMAEPAAPAVPAVAITSRLDLPAMRAAAEEAEAEAEAED